MRCNYGIPSEQGFALLPVLSSVETLYRVERGLKAGIILIVSRTWSARRMSVKNTPFRMGPLTTTDIDKNRAGIEPA